MAKEYDIEDIRRSGTYPDVSVELLQEIPLPDKGDRTRWFGVQHGDLVSQLAEGIRNAGVKYEKDTWTLSGKGERLHGYIHVSLSEEEFEWTKEALDLPDEITYDSFAFNEIDLRLGLRHSNDSTVALYVMVIPRTKEHGNGITVDGGNISLHRRHTHKLGGEEDGLENAIKDGVRTFLLKAAQIEQEIRMLKAIPLTDRSAHHIMVTAAAKKIIPWSTIGKIQAVWAEDKGSNAWDIYQAITRAGMVYNVAREMAIVSQSRKLILELCDEAEDVIEAEGLEEVVNPDPEGITDELLRTGHFAPNGDEVQDDAAQADEVPEEGAEEIVGETVEEAQAPVVVETTEILDTKPAPTHRLPKAATKKDWDLADVF